MINNENCNIEKLKKQLVEKVNKKESDRKLYEIETRIN